MSIIAQKPSSTGSGVYLSELVRCFKEMGHEQEIICAAYDGDIVGLDIIRPSARENLNTACENFRIHCMGELCESRMGELYEPHYNKIIFNTGNLPIKIAGMSDVMPYPSIKYSELASDEEKLKIWMDAFDKKVKEVIDRFKPDLIICHHLYLLTAMVASIVDSRIYGISHNTDLRQYQQTDLKRDYIKENLKKLDKAFFLSEEHADKAIELFGLERKKIEIIGIGYNSNIFKNNRNYNRELDYGNYQKDKHDKATINLLYVGKVTKKKGVLSLVKAINILNDENIILDIIGGTGDKAEYDEIVNESKKSKSKINFIAPLTQDKLAIEYSNHDILILPSFFEGMPLVPLEAMACGCKVVISDLPGVKVFYSANVKNASIKYVELPKLTNVDEASDEELDAFEKRLASAIRESIDDRKIYKPDLSNISWESIARRIVDGGS